MIEKFKKWFENKFLIKFELVTDSSCFQEISDVLEYSFQTTMEKDNFKFSQYEDFRENLESIWNECGQIFVVKYGRKIVGTISYTHRNVNRWYHKGEAVKISHYAILPKYQHLGLGKRLISIILDHAKEQNLPVVVYTPEKNINAIKYYEKYGFYKVRMYLSKEHYSVALYRPVECSDSFTKKQQKRYAKSAILCLMENWTICDTQSDQEIQKRWEKYYLPYLACENEDIRTDMCNAYRKWKISPKQYKRLNFESMTEEERKEFMEKGDVR